MQNTTATTDGFWFFTQYKKAITNAEILRDLRREYRAADYIVWFFVVISETNDGDKFIDRTFRCILSRKFQSLCVDSRFYFKNDDIVPSLEQAEVRGWIWQGCYVWGMLLRFNMTSLMTSNLHLINTSK